MWNQVNNIFPPKNSSVRLKCILFFSYVKLSFKKLSEHFRTLKNVLHLWNWIIKKYTYIFFKICFLICETELLFQEKCSHYFAPYCDELSINTVNLICSFVFAQVWRQIQAIRLLCAWTETDVHKKCCQVKDPWWDLSVLLFWQHFTIKVWCIFVFWLPTEPTTKCQAPNNTAVDPVWIHL